MARDGQRRDKSPVSRSEYDRTKREIAKMADNLDTMQQTIQVVGALAIETSSEVNDYRAAQQVVFFASVVARTALLEVLAQYREGLDAVRSGTQEKGVPLTQDSLVPSHRVPSCRRSLALSYCC